MKSPSAKRWTAVLRPPFRWMLAAFMLFAGSAHLVATDAFLAVVPTWLPLRSAIVLASGVIEIGLGLALLLADGERRRQVGWALAGFFVLVFPGNIYQAVTGTYAFGLDTPVKRWVRLVFQPILIAWALWASGVWIPRRRTLSAPGVSSPDG